MKTFFLFIGITVILFKLNITSVRTAYKTAVISKSEAIVFYEKLQKVTKQDKKVFVAYKGAATTLIAKQQKSIKKKKELFKKGVALVEYAIQKEPNNIEIRFIRLSIQQNIPKFLKYHKQIEVDKIYILSNIKKIKSTDLKKYVTSYILQSKHFTEEEKLIIK